MKKIRHLFIFIGGFFLFILDQSLKLLSLYIFTNAHLWLNIIGWQPFKNNGIAFSLPLPNFLTITLTIPTIIIISFFLFNFNKDTRHQLSFLGLSLIFWGALSNLSDRIIHHTTIDYILIGTGIINFADILIISGFIILFFKPLFKKK